MKQKLLQRAELLSLCSAVGEPKSSDIWFCVFVYFHTGSELRSSHNSGSLTLDDMEYFYHLEEQISFPPIC